MKQTKKTTSKNSALERIFQIGESISTPVSDSKQAKIAWEEHAIKTIHGTNKLTPQL